MHTLNYGMKAQKLANNLGITVEKAQELMDRYMAKWTAVGRFFQDTQNELEATGYAYTFMGRRRYLPAVRSPRPYERFRAGRQAANSKIQGCQPASTKVLTKQGYQRLGDIPETGEVWTGMEWAPYTRLNRGPWQLAEIHFRNGQVLRCDTRHKVLLSGKDSYYFEEFNNLKVGDSVAFSLAKELEYGSPPPGVSEEDFYWMGYATGNGCTSHGDGHPNALSICFGDRKGRYTKEQQLERYLSYLQGRGWTPQAPRIFENKVSVVVEKKEVRATLESWGVAWGALAAGKRIPTSVWSSDLRSRKAYLRGLLDADGTIGANNHTPCLHLCQKLLLEEVMILARTCGIHGRIQGPHPTKEGGQSFQLHFLGSHTLKALGYGEAVTKETVPRVLLPRNAAQEVLKKVPKGRTPSEATLLRRVATGGSLGAYTASTLLGEERVPELYACSEITKLVVLDEVEETYTLSVDHPSHRFDSEGVITKNTAAEIAKMAMNRLYYEGHLAAIGWRMLSQIHDELLCEGPEETVEDAKAIIKEAMENPFGKTPFPAPLAAAPASGDSWWGCK